MPPDWIRGGTPMIGARVLLPLQSADGRKMVLEITLESFQTLQSHAVDWTSEQYIRNDRQKIVLDVFGAAPRCESRDFLTAHESQFTLFTNRNADDDLLVRSGHPAETRLDGKKQLCR